MSPVNQTSIRRVCEGCRYPAKVCICEFVESLDNSTQVIVIQHPKEQHHSKNTVRLLELGLTNLEVFRGESATELQDLKQRCQSSPSRYWLIYPNECSNALETYASKSTPPNAIILIDGTWRKAFRIWKLNPWLQELPSLHFNSAPPTNYQIRRSPKAFGLSTLEATAYCLQLIEHCDVKPLHRLQDALNRKWSGYSEVGREQKGYL